MAKDNTLYTFYQHSYQGHEMIFSGRFPGSEVPNFTLRTILQYAERFRDFRFRLILRNNVTLSFVKEKGRGYFEIGQILSGDTLTRNPCFNADDYGLVMKYPSEAAQFIYDLVQDDTWGLDYVKGA